jgi:hypothetical protein
MEFVHSIKKIAADYAISFHLLTLFKRIIKWKFQSQRDIPAHIINPVMAIGGITIKLKILQPAQVILVSNIQ